MSCWRRSSASSPTPAVAPEHSTAAPRTSFSFQAEDGIRYLYVTGVQTCALPISRGPCGPHGLGRPHGLHGPRGPHGPCEIGRAECRERVEVSGVAVSLEKKK